MLLGNNGNKFSINDKTGVVTLLDFVDYNIQKLYGLEIAACDFGTTSLCAAVNATVTISITPTTGTIQPIFSLSHYQYNINESNVEEVLGTLEVTNKNKSSGISYSIRSASPDASYFSINSNGVISFKGGDYEEKKTRNVVVEARFSSGLAGTTHVLVSLKDVNDNDPSFSKLQHTASISEAAEIGETVTVFYGHDKDSTKNGELTFTLLTHTDIFMIKTINNMGVVTLASHLDREMKSEYSVFVSLSDQGSPVRNSSQNSHVTVIVLDENDNNPKPTSNISVIDIAISTAVGSVIHNVTFDDLDAGVNKGIGI